MSGGPSEGAKQAGSQGGIWAVSALWAAAVIGVVLVATLIPWHMDEFIMYHVLACWEPSQQLNVYRESCTGYTTRLGPIEFQRAYTYVGTTSSLLLAPFHALFPSIWTPYAVGALVLSASVWGLARSFNLPWRMMPAMLLFFPLVFATLRDGGPVRVSLLMMAWTPIVTAKFLEAKQFRILWLLLLMVMWAVAIEDKPFFAYLIPGIALLSVASLFSKGLVMQALESWKFLVILFGASFLFCITLLAVMQVGGVSYLHYLVAASPDRSIESIVSSVLSGLLLTADWPYYAHRVSDYPSLGDPGFTGLLGKLTEFLPLGWSFQAVAALILHIIVFVLVVGLYAGATCGLVKSQERVRRQTVLLLLVSAVALWIGAVAAGGWASHHFVYAQVPLLVLLACAFTRYDWGQVRLGAALGGLAILSLIAIWLVPVRAYASREIPIAFEAALEAADTSTIINCASWGCYYTYSLLNRRNIPVVFAVRKHHTEQLEDAARRLNRRIVHICLECDLPDVQNRYPQSAASRVDTDTQQWRVYRIDPLVQPLP